MRFSDLIAHFAHADGPPPRRLWPFVNWALAGAWGVIGITALSSIAVGVSEIAGFWLIGHIIDLALNAGASGVFSQHGAVLIGATVFFLALRPGIMWLSASLQNLGVMNNLYPLVMSRVHRHTIGQPMAFFDDDFAGRIAQKQQQTARAVADVVGEILQAGGIAVASIIASVALLGGIDPRLALALGIWALIVIAMVRWFLPRIRKRARNRAAARAMVTGQVVDTITNIQTVKLFAHDDHEDSAALDAMAAFRTRGIEFSGLVVWFRTAINTLAGALPVILIGGSIWLWSRGIATPGDITAAAMVAARLANMTGWVSFTALGVFSNIGEIEDGIRTLAHDHAITDRAGARTPGRVRGAIAFDQVSFGYGRAASA